MGLGLTIPLAFGSDLVMGKPDVFTTSSILGALAVLVGFVLVNVGNDDDGTTTVAAANNENHPVELSTRMSSENVESSPPEDAANRTIV